MELSVTLSANAGVSVQVGEDTLWVDALHEDQQAGFSAVSSRLQGQMLAHSAFQNPKWIFYTHCHGDHFSPELTRAAKKLWPQAELFLPERVFPNQHLLGEAVQSRGELTFYRFPHEGAQYANVSHYGLIANFSGCNVLFTGDCATASPALAEVLRDRKIDVAVLPFPWLTLKKGRDFVNTYLAEAVLVVCHLPFPEDDGNGYRSAAEQAVQKMPNRDIRLMMQPLQTEIIKI